LILINLAEQNFQVVGVKKFSTIWKKKKKIVNGGQGKSTRQEKMNAVKYRSETIFEYFDRTI